MKVRECLWSLRLVNEVHQERTLATKLYLEVCIDYINVFLSINLLDLCNRVVLASKVFFSSYRNYG